MQAFAVTFSGMQPTASIECQELIGTHSDQNDFGILFDSAPSSIARFAYHSQSAVRVLISPIFFDSENINSAHANFSKEFSSSKDVKFKTFRIDCDRLGSHEYSSKDISASLAKIICERMGVGVNLSDPDVIFYCLIRGGKAVFGMDICGFDLSKRYYRVFASPSSLRGPVGYFIARNTNPKKVFLDPQCGSGITPIEMGLWCSGKSLHQYEMEKLIFTRMELFKDGLEKAFEPRKPINLSIYAYDSFMPNVYASKKNAKIAGVQKLIHFGRIDFEWMDIKFDEKEVDSVAINMQKTDLKSFETLFYQLDFIMTKKSSVVVVSNSDISAIPLKYGFVRYTEAVLGWNSTLKISCFSR